MNIDGFYGLAVASTCSVSLGSINPSPPYRLVASVRSAKRMQDLTCACAVGGGAAAPEIPELRLQYRQVCYTVDDVPDVLVEQRVDALAVFSGGLAKIEQRTDFIECHVQGAAMPDEQQALGVKLVIGPIIVRRPVGRSKQANPLVVANGFNQTT